MAEEYVSPCPNMKGQPCAYCGKPSEGYYAIHRDGFGEGPEVPLCVACGDDETPTCEEIWSKIGRAPLGHSETVHEVTVGDHKAVLKILNMTVSELRLPDVRQQLAKKFGCDACGVRQNDCTRVERAERDFFSKYGGTVFKLTGVHLCHMCMHNRQSTTVVSQVLENVFEKKLPVKAVIYENGSPCRLYYDGLNTFMAHQKASVVNRTTLLEVDEVDCEPLREKLARGRSLLAGLEDVAKGSER